MSHNDVVRSEGLGGWGLILLVAIIAALFSMLSQPQKNAVPPDVSPVPSAPAQASATAAPTSATAAPAVLPSDVPPISLSPTEAALQLQSGFVSAEQICPIVTDHRTTLAISLVLRNDTQVTEHVAGLAPALPLPGIVDKGTTVHSGTCTKPYSKAAKPNGRVLPPGTTVVVTMHLELPRTCPQPLPVGLDVTLSIAGDVRSEHLALFSDLGSIPFDTCPTK